MKIKEVPIGYPVKQATDLFVRTFPIETDATTCGLYYWMTTEENEQVSEGNLWLTEQEFEGWGKEMSYIDDLVLEKLELERLE